MAMSCAQFLSKADAEEQTKMNKEPVHGYSEPERKKSNAIHRAL